MGAVERLSGAPRLLLMLPQFPRDPASGAARTATTVAELLAETGFVVEAIGTTATEGHAAIDFSRWPELQPARDGGFVRFQSRGVRFTLLDTGAATVSGWENMYGMSFDALLDERLARFRPDLVLTYGGSPADLARRRRARTASARVVFGLYNARYRSRGCFDDVDAVITPSEFLTRFYRDALGLESTPLLTPLWPDDVLAIAAEPSRLTMVNPSLEKGLIFFASLSDALRRRCPQIPIEVFPSRGSPSFLVQAALAAGLDLSAHPRFRLRATEERPAALYRRARVLVVPSLDDDAAPRVVAEALANGIPPIGSDRGGIPEMCARGGFVLPVPRRLDARSLEAVAPEHLEPWVALIERLFASEAFWREASGRARRAGAAHLPPSVTDRYVEFFTGLLTQTRKSA